VPTLPSGLPEDVGDQEDLARFLTSRSYFSTQIVKPVAFLPDRQGETSVFRHGSEPREALWNIASDHAVGERTLHGAAILKARYVRQARLDVLADEPPLRHAVIVGWDPSDPDPQMAKAAQKEQALELAQNAQLLLYS
jgi:hypothetical protein